MSVSFTLGPRFPEGTTVKAYPVTNWPNSGQPSGAPIGASSAEAAVTGGAAAFTGLVAGTEYWAAAQVGGRYRYVRFTAGEDVADSADHATKGEVNILNLGTDWSSGERLFGFTAQNVTGKKLEMNNGTAAAPDDGNQPNAVFTRVLKTPEASFSGDGAGNLCAVRAHTTAVAGSEGQAIGMVSSAITFSTYEAGHSLADGIGMYALGVSKGSSTRTGMGIFVNGRTETSTGRATGMEIVVDNESETEDSWTGAFPRTKAMHLHAVGLKPSAVGMFVSDKGAGLHTAIAAQTKALISSAFIRDDSEAPWSHLIKGKHAKAALAIASGAGPLVIGIEEAASAATLLEVNGGGEVKDPLYNFKVTGGKSVRGRLIENGGTGQVNAWVAGGANSFVTGTVASDSGIGYAPGTTFHIGANGKTSMFRLTEAGIGFFGTAAQAKPTGVAKTAEAIWTALNTLGLIA